MREPLPSTRRVGRSPPSVRAWVTRPLTHSPQTHIFPLPPFSPSSFSSSSSTFLGTAEKMNSGPTSGPTSSPTTPSPSRPAARTPRSLTEEQRQRISELAPLARRYRSGTNPDTAPARANAELTALCRSHLEDGVSTRELAQAAGVTYSAMRRRLTT
jgi:hypothetical protein